MAASPAPAAESGIGINLSAMDRSVNPGDDFYGYSNGSWQRSAVIPADRSSTGSFLTAFETTERQQGELIDAIMKSKPAPGSDQARIHDYYQAYMDTAAIDKAGLKPVQADLARYAAIKDKTTLARIMGEQTEADVDLFNSTDLETENLFGLFITKALTRNEVVPYLFQGGLGLPDREYYLSDNPKMVSIRKAYRTYIEKLLTLSGIPDAPAKAERIFSLETRIAQAHASAEVVADFAKGGTLWSREQLKNKAPGLDWDVYLQAADLGKQATFDVYNPASITGIATLVASEPLDAWKDWLAFHRINENADVLPEAIDKLHFAFYGTTLSGTPEQRPRAKRAIAAVNTDLGNAFGHLYVNAYFPASAKAEVQDMVEHIKAAFVKRIQALDWMTPATKQEALAKVRATIVSVGYPDHWLDYAGMTVHPDQAFANHLAAVQMHTQQQLAKLGKPVDRSEWWMEPQLVNAVNLPVQNALNFPAAILQKPFFDPSADAAFNYGAIGAVIGHELSHSFDANGAMVDSHGNLRNWWTPEDFAHFKQQSEALAKQFDTYAPFPDLHVNGQQTLGENGADVAGLAASFDAYRASLNGKELPVEDGLTGDQRFFIAFDQTWQSKAREAALRALVISNGHAPGQYRALTVRNLDAWYKAFDVPTDAALYLAPDQRVRLW